MSSILKQAGILTGQKMKAEKDAMAAESVAKNAAQLTARNERVADMDSDIAAVRANELAPFESDADAEITKLDSTFTAEVANILDDSDPADLDSIKDAYDALIAQDAEKDLGIVNYFSASNAALATHDAAYGDYDAFLSGYNAEVA